MIPLALLILGFLAFAELVALTYVVWTNARERQGLLDVWAWR